jgi:tRNA1(Val) A37 N6-methylase TrmN6
MGSRPPPKATTEDALLGGRVRLRQPARGFRAGSDAVLLAAACPARAGDAVLDLGCGVGAAAACLAARVPGLRIAGLERDGPAAALAQINLPAAEIVVGDALCPPPALRARAFDHVICNPPYFAAGRGSPSPDAAREAALREAGEGGLAAWTDAAIRRVRSGGSLTLIARAERLPELLAACAGRLGRLRALPLAPRAGARAHRVLLGGRKGARAPFALLPPVALHGPDGAPSTEARAVLWEAGRLSLD